MNFARTPSPVAAAPRKRGDPWNFKDMNIRVAESRITPAVARWLWFFISPFSTMNNRRPAGDNSCPKYLRGMRTGVLGTPKQQHVAAHDAEHRLRFAGPNAFLEPLQAAHWQWFGFSVLPAAIYRATHASPGAPPQARPCAARQPLSASAERSLVASRRPRFGRPRRENDAPRSATHRRVVSRTRSVYVCARMGVCTRLCPAEQPFPLRGQLLI